MQRCACRTCRAFPELRNPRSLACDHNRSAVLQSELPERDSRVALAIGDRRHRCAYLCGRHGKIPDLYPPDACWLLCPRHRAGLCDPQHRQLVCLCLPRRRWQNPVSNMSNQAGTTFKRCLGSEAFFTNRQLWGDLPQTYPEFAETLRREIKNWSKWPV